jgi:hypothetical protein
MNSTSRNPLTAAPHVMRASVVHRNAHTLHGGRSHVTTLLVRSASETEAHARALRELHAPNLSAYERDYLNWYHGDPLKRSLSKAHDHSMNHRAELMASQHCGCFQCGSRFSPVAITEWVRDAMDDTALCPHCDIDAVLGDASGYPITEEFLRSMKLSWFGED